MSGAALSSGALPSGVVKHRGLITVSIMLATVMQTIDTTIANVALPHMQGSLSAAQDQISWVLTSYIVAAAVATPMTGWLAGRFGRKRTLTVSVVGFTVASLLCGAAVSLPQIVVFRLLQGLFGASLAPMAQSVLLDINPREKHGSAMAIYGAGIMVGPILGPTLGGWLTDTYNWRWVFYINLPIGILAFLGITAFMTETAQSQRRPFDFFGFAMLGLAIGALQMMLDRGEQKDWFGSTEIWIEFGVTVCALWVFLVHFATSENPFVSPSLFKDRNFVAGVILMFIMGILLYGTMALSPTLLQQLMNYPVITTGLILAPRGVGTVAAMLVVGKLSGKVDVRLVLLFGLLVMAGSLYAMEGFSLDMGMSLVLITGIGQGLGMGFLFVPLSTAAFATLPPHLRTEGTSFFSLLRNLGGSFGISIVENVLVRSIQANHASLAQHVTPYNPMLRLPNVARLWDIGTTRGLAALDAEVNRQAAMISYIDDFKLMMIVTLLMIPFLPLLSKPQRAKVSPQEMIVHD
jgi:DHA2 family multidrug resistance protein